MKYSHVQARGFTKLVAETQVPCRDADPEIFFQDEFEYGRSDTERAKALCRTCPIRFECLEHALTTPEHFGVFGGLSAAERRELQRRERRAA